MKESVKSNKALPVIVAASILLPLIVALLFFAPKIEFIPGFDYYVLPKINAIINGTTFIVLIVAFVAIKNKNIRLHKILMNTAIVLSVVFLLCYVAYHTATEPTRYGGEGVIRTVYFVILFSHIVLAAVIVPLVLISYTHALSERFDKHRKIAKLTLPLWLYVSITGVIAYFMISPYYVH